MRQVRRIVERVSDIGGYFAGVLVLVMMGLVMFESSMRYVVGRSPGISDEISAYMFIGVVFLGLAYTWKERGHVRIELLTSRLSTKKAQLLRLATLIIALVYSIVASTACWGFVLETAQRGWLSQTWLRIPLHWPELPLAIGFGFLALQLIIEIAKVIMDISSARKEETV